MRRKRYQRKFVLYGQRHILNYISLIWASIHCGSKMEKQNLKAEES